MFNTNIYIYIYIIWLIFFFFPHLIWDSIWIYVLPDFTHNVFQLCVVFNIGFGIQFKILWFSKFHAHMQAVSYGFK